MKPEAKASGYLTMGMKTPGHVAPALWCWMEDV